MKVGLWPFYSQQRKTDGYFLQRTCGNVKQLAFLQHELTSRGHKCVAVVPERCVDTPLFSCFCHEQLVPPNNPIQRVHWDTEALYYAFKDCDVVVTNHDYGAIPLRTMFPKLRIIQQCNTVVDNRNMFAEAFKCADLVVAQGDAAASKLRFLSVAPVTTWRMAYDEREFNGTPIPGGRDIDVCFIQRCSANNATHHIEFIQAMNESKWKVVFTDVTHYLRKENPNWQYSTPETYTSALFRSKVVVSMHQSDYGGMSVREAIRAGCIPVVLNTPGYMELCGPSWPLYTLPAARFIRAVVDKALQTRHIDLPDVSQDSYQAGVIKAVRDVCGI